VPAAGPHCPTSTMRRFGAPAGDMSSQKLCFSRRQATVAGTFHPGRTPGQSHSNSANDCRSLDSCVTGRAMSSMIQALTVQYCSAHRVLLYGANGLLEALGNTMSNFETACEIFPLYMGASKSTSELIINQLTITFPPAVHLQANTLSSTFNTKKLNTPSK
jgi:hypothetical protein